ncbi:LysR family transcriptional regulator [Aeromonas veronii]|uniref:LysR family transcriptional regulator n=1 Tax=Aeromonas veronii TaxID=654 RepID=UPI003F37A2D6
MLDNLALFLTIVEKGGLSAAGRELGLSPATVSERLAAIERHYGVALLTRTTRSISLTEEGRLLVEEGRRLLADADDLQRRIQFGSQEITGPIRLSAPVDLGTTRLVPLLDQFIDMHPGITIDLNLTDGYVDLVTQGLDFALRYGTLADSSLRTISLGQNPRIVCASPDYLRRRGVPRHPEELLQHDCLVMRFGENLARSWEFTVDGTPYRVLVAGPRITNNGLLVRQWCLQGLGLCFKSRWDVQDDLAKGTLVEVLASFSSNPSRLQLVYPSNRNQPRRVRTLMDAIAAQLRTDSSYT